MISYVNSFPGIQPWFHDILHSTEFTHQFMIMNSYMISLSWIHQHEFKDEFNLTYDFTIFFMIIKWYLNSYYEFKYDFMIMNSYVTFHDLWIHIRIHVYEEYREIIPQIMCTKVPHVYVYRQMEVGVVDSAMSFTSWQTCNFSIEVNVSVSVFNLTGSDQPKIKAS